MVGDDYKMDRALALEKVNLERNKELELVISRGDSPVQQFYAGSVVLITGGSGFLGKQLIYKLFKSCKIKKMYVLLRAAHKTVEARLDDITRDQLYDSLRKTQPDFIKRMVPVSGDISKEGLGIDGDTWNDIGNEVNVIFHSAATINFEEHLKLATLTNVRGTIEMLRLAQQCKNLKSYVHISTAYSHATKSRANQQVLEEFYPAPVAPDYLINLVQDLSYEKVEALTPGILADWPNTYSFTKAVAEEAVRTMAGTLPICIVRPAIVMGSLREPPGWVDKSTINGPTGFILGVALGGLHTVYADSKVRMEMVPVDLVNNAVVIAASETAARREQGQTDVKIYNVLSRQCMTLDMFYKIMHTDVVRSYAPPAMIWYPFCIITQSKLLLFLVTWLLHYIPGFLADGALMLLGKKPKAIRLLTKAYRMNNVFSFFMRNGWKFGDSNLMEMFRRLTPADQLIYACDTSIVDNQDYMLTCSIGVRKYILKDGLQNTNYALKKMQVLRVLNVIYLAGYAYLLWRIILFCFSCLVTVFNFISY